MPLPEKKLQKLRNKIVGLLSLGIISVGLIAFYSLFLLSDKITRYDLLIEQEVYASALADNINLNFKRQVQEWKNVLLRGHKQSDREKYWHQFVDIQNLIQQKTKTFLALPILPEFTEKMQTFQRQHKALMKEYELGYNVFQQSQFSHIEGDTEVRGIDREPTKLLESLAENMRVTTAEKSQDLTDAARQSVAVAITVMLLVIFISLLMTALFMHKKVVKPLMKLIEQLIVVSRGNYSQSLVFERNDEIGIMSRAIERLRQNLSSINNDLGDSRNELSQVADSLQESATAISLGVKQQNSGTDEVSHSMQQMTGMAVRITDSAKQAYKEAKSVQTATKVSQQFMQETIETMKRSSLQIEDTAQVIRNLDEETQNVGSVIDVIESIAEQTNLLALNAAIEAARAGEQGRGFAVVADEVRTLASRTQKSTVEIKKIIAKLVLGAQNSVEAIDHGQKQSKASVEKVLEVDRNIQKVNVSIDQISQIVKHIAEAISEQSHLSDQITSRLESLTDIAKLNSLHADSCAKDNQTLGQLRIRMEHAIDRLQGKTAQ